MRNDAQHAFLALLETLEPADTTREVIVKEALYGTLNLAALSNAGFKRVETVRFTVAGELTEVINVPSSVTTLDIPHQRLTELVDLPTKLVSLNISHNDIVHWSAKETPHLQHLDVNNNRLETLTDLPASLRELTCDDNVLKRLDLSETVALTKLHCRNNPLMTIERLPPTVVNDLEFDSTPFLDLTYQGQENDGAKDVVVRKRNFNLRECLDRYFQLKQTYEEDVRTRRREAKDRALRSGLPLKESVAAAKKGTFPKCIQCGHEKGTVFSRDKQHYRARCGANKCDLLIDIFMGDHDSLSILAEEFRDHMEESKQAIIEQKMKTLFGYLDKRHSAELFKENVNLYKEVSENCQTFTAKWKHLYDNPEKKAEEQRLRDHVAELDAKQGKLLASYRLTHDRAILRQAMSDHVREVVPAHRAYQRFVYPHMWIEGRRIQKEDADVAEEEEQILVQQRHAIQDDDVVYGEAARVIHFRIDCPKKIST